MSNKTSKYVNEPDGRKYLRLEKFRGSSSLFFFVSKFFLGKTMENSSRNYKPHTEKSTAARENFISQLREVRVNENLSQNVGISDQIDRMIEQENEMQLAELEQNIMNEEEYYARMAAFNDYLDSLSPEERAVVANQQSFLSDSD